MASQGVRRRIFTANSQVHFQSRAYGICGEQVAPGQTFFLGVIRFYSASFPSNKADSSIMHVPSEDIRTCIQSVPVTTSLCKPYIYTYIYHSFSSLSYDRSKASSKASSPHSAIQSFLLQMRVSSPFLKVIQ